MTASWGMVPIQVSIGSWIIVFGGAADGRNRTPEIPTIFCLPTNYGAIRLRRAEQGKQAGGISY